MRPTVIAVAVITLAGCSGRRNPVISHVPLVDRVDQPAAIIAPAATAKVNLVPPPAESASRDRNEPAKTISDILNQHLVRLNDALFDYDKATIRDDARGVLQNDVQVIRQILADHPAQSLIIEGHCDERGSEEYNLALGDRRATAAKEFLVSMGISPAQLSVISYGNNRPACTDRGEDCWQKNRRAHVTAAP